jgi:hypothetical protein|tara:strand:- start:1185 stop:1880 length:696 start_codon:yes stop_codon:yes gene_type:complete
MKIKVEIPNTINGIKLVNYQKYNKIMKASPDANDEFLETKLLEIFCGVSYKDIIKMPLGTFDEATQHVHEIFKAKTPLIRRFTMTGSDGVEVEFGFIPNLDKMTMGEYIDLNNYIEDTDMMHKAMAVLFRPIHSTFKDKEKYLISTYDGAAQYGEMMKDMPLGIALGARVFFYRLGMKLSRAILNSFQALDLSEEGSLSEEEKKLLTANTAGIKNFMHLQTEMLSNYKGLH